MICVERIARKRRSHCRVSGIWQQTCSATYWDSASMATCSPCFPRGSQNLCMTGRRLFPLRSSAIVRTILTGVVFHAWLSPNKSILRNADSSLEFARRRNCCVACPAELQAGVPPVSSVLSVESARAVRSRRHERLLQFWFDFQYWYYQRNRLRLVELSCTSLLNELKRT